MALDPSTLSPADPVSVDLGRITKIHVAGLLAGVVLGVTTHWLEPWSLLLGGGVMALNVWLLKLVTNVLISGGSDSQNSRKAALAVGGFVLHFGIFLGMAAALFWRVPVDAMSFAVGITMLLAACVIEAVGVSRARGKGAR